MRAVASGMGIRVDGLRYARHCRFVGCCFEFRAGMKGHYATGWNVHHGACLWIATGSRYFVAEPETAEPSEFDETPRSRTSLISAKNASTMSLASRLLRPTCSNTSSASSALVSVGPQSPATCSALAGGHARVKPPTGDDGNLLEKATAVVKSDAKSSLPMISSGATCRSGRFLGSACL